MTRTTPGSVRCADQSRPYEAELADRMGVDRAYVSGLELGQRNPTIVTLWHLAEALSVKLQLFFDDSPRSRAR
jgi:transcriptional regulator with XRE-family HTH domain